MFLQHTPHKLIWIAVGRIGRQIKEPQFAAQSFNEGLRLLRYLKQAINPEDAPPQFLQAL
jgi:hypothetical protein